jgi:hypothetical protein
VQEALRTAAQSDFQTKLTIDDAAEQSQRIDEVAFPDPVGPDQYRDVAKVDGGGLDLGVSLDGDLGDLARHTPSLSTRVLRRADKPSSVRPRSGAIVGRRTAAGDRQR